MTEPTLEVSSLLTVRDVERLARTMLPKSTVDYFRSGSDAEYTRRANRGAFRKWAIAYRVLVDVSRVDTRVRVLGQELASPILIAPTAYHRLAHPEGERATARAAGGSGTLYVASTLATTSLEDIAATYDAAGASAGGASVGGASRWFQLYVHKDRGLTRSLVERAEASGYGALVVTVDTPVLGRRLRDVRNAFGLPDGMHMANLFAPGDGIEAKDPAFRHAQIAARHDASFTWHDLASIRAWTRMPLVLKGIVRADDALRARDSGVAGIIVSNHGGRQLDSAVATLDALPSVVEALGAQAGVDVLLDGGVRWGTDVFKALALGARAVLVGRPIVWGLTAFGEAGVARVLDILRSELVHAMTLAGCPAIDAVTRDMLVRR
ncbi:alpha-hydroxy acid oxidase [Pendulispora albinea]|uniref:Alpha-hydroxy-acid oxidizing protein n=1 Tax=Pendulispora albinea TaxID=2741071 RepID=A0ABZ2LP58_9BACT